MPYILKSGNKLLKSGNFFLTSASDIKPPLLDINPALFPVVANFTPLAELLNTASSIQPIQQIATAQAKYLANDINGLPAIWFDGNDYYTLPLGFSARTLFIVTRFADAAAYTDASLFGNNGQGGPYSYFQQATSAEIGHPDNMNLNRLFVNGVKAEFIWSANRNNFYTIIELDISSPLNLVTISDPRNGFGYWGAIARFIAYDYRLTEFDRIKKRNELRTLYNL